MGKANFIALNMDDDIIEALYSAALSISERITTHSFNPMNRSVLHMTICFLGGALGTDRKRKIAVIDSNIRDFSSLFGGAELEFDGYSLFPETKRNLIVAKFKCRDRNFIPNMITYKNSYLSIGAPKEDFFVAHITLGKLQAAHLNTEELDEFVRSLPALTHKIVIESCRLV